MKKILILINQAPNYALTYTEIGKKLKTQGFDVTYAIDSTFTYFEHKNLFDKDDEIIIFSDYFKANFKNPKLVSKELLNKDLWMLYYSDYERQIIYGLHKNKSDDYFKSLIINILNFFEELFSKNEINIILYENVTNMFAYGAYLIGKKYKVYYFGVTATALPNRISIESEPFFKSKEISDTYYRLLNGEEKVPEDVKILSDNYYKNFMALEPDYMENERKLLKQKLFFKYFNTAKFSQIFLILKYFKTYGLKENFYNFQSPPLTINYAYFKRNFLRKLRLNQINKLYDINKIEDLVEENYIIYPIHFHPEASTSLFAPQYIDEYYNIINIALSLPFNYTLLVKEHPSAVGFREINFYKQIKAIPNVKLVQHNLKAKLILKKIKAVITITNTMGYESLIMGKKTFLLGRIFYETHPNCVNVSSFKNLFKDLERELEDNYTPTDPEKFIQAHYMNTHEGVAVYEKEVNLAFVNQVVTLIKQYFESKKNI